MSLTIQRPMAQLNMIKLTNVPKWLSLQKPLTQFKVFLPHPCPIPWLPNQASLIRTKSLIPTGAIEEFGNCGVQRLFKKMISVCTCTERSNTSMHSRALSLKRPPFYNIGIVRVTGV